MKKSNTATQSFFAKADTAATAVRDPGSQEVGLFRELETLCASSGFIHAIAFCCMRDNIFSYSGEARPEDMSQLYDASRLVRNEMNVLVGLLVKKEIDFAIPTKAVIAGYVQESARLLSEIHEVAAAPLTDSTFVYSHFGEEHQIDSLRSGAAMREAIFYGGESAYHFQYRDFAPVRYMNDDSWIIANMGFSMGDAALVVKTIGKLINASSTAAFARAEGDLAKTESFLSVFEFTAEEVAAKSNLTSEITDRILSAFTYPNADTNLQFRDIDAKNKAAILPLLRHNEKYILFNIFDLCEVLYQAPYFWMLGDRGYQPKATENRGKFTEDFAAARLRSVFGVDHVKMNVKILRGKDIAGEVDVLVMFADIAIILQAKSKQLTALARQGNERQMHKDFGAAVQDACDQGVSCARLLLDKTTKMLDPSGERVPHSGINKIFVICLVADHYPALAYQAREFLTFDPLEKVAPPLVTDVFLLDAMTEMLDSPLRLLSYLDRRCSYNEQLMSSHELNILGYHLSHNLWFEGGVNLVHLGDDFGSSLELSMLARRDDLDAQWTPPGILTRFEGTALDRLVKSIERRPDAGMVGLGFAILAMNEETALQISSALDEIVRRTRHDRQKHDFTVQMKGSDGLTFHCNVDSDADARDFLLTYCTMRKYVQRSDRWFGLVVDAASGEMRFGVVLDSKWIYNRQLEEATDTMRRVPKISRADFKAFGQTRTHKIGRNDSCPCGSGKKSKRCCAA